MSPDLPVGWAWAQLGDIVAVRGEKLRPDQSNGLPFIGMDDVLPGSLKVASHGWFREMKSTANAVHPRDILYGRLRPYLNKVAIAEVAAAASAEFIVLTARAGISARYVQFVLHAKQFVNFATRDTSGDRPRIDFDKISKFEIPVPPTAEQRRIVARIDELFAEIAEGEAALERARQGLDTWRRALLKAAVAGDLTRDWREANRPAETGADLLTRIRAERSASNPNLSRKRRANAVLSPDNTTPGKLPEGWVWASVQELFAWSSGDFLPSRSMRPGNIPVYGGNGITGYHDQSLVKEPTVIIGRVGFYCGSVHLTVEPAWITDNAIYAKSMPVGCHPGFLKAVLGAANIPHLAQGGAQPFVNQKLLNSLCVPLCSSLEQEEIVRRLQQQSDAGDVTSFTADQVDRERTVLRQSILKAAFEGRLVAQDPADQPASVLLARLRNGYPSNGARRRRARGAADISHPSLPGLTHQPLDPRAGSAGND